MRKFGALFVLAVGTRIPILSLQKRSDTDGETNNLELRTGYDFAPNPAACIDCREMSAVDAMPCMRSLKSSALEAFSSAVS